MSGVERLVGLGVADYTVFVLVLATSAGIGFFYAFRGNKDPEDFLMGGRSMSIFPVSLSLLSTFISSISLLGYSGEAYGHGVELSLMLLGSFTGVFLAMVLFLPVFFPLKLTSVNEYIEMRFRSKGLRLLVVLVSVLSSMLYLGLCLYAPTLALSSVTTISIDNYIIILGVICTFYSTLGGLKAVVWTDTFQMTVMILGLIAVIITGSLNVGGLSNVWAIAAEHNRTQFFDFNFNIYQRHNFWNIITMGTALYFSMYGTNQTNLQRACSVPTLRNAVIVYMLNLVGMIITLSLVFLAGLCAFANYAGCDPLTQGFIDSKDQILPYFVMDKIGSYGMAGLIVATLLSGTLSSLSSVINAMAAMVWSECSERYMFFRNMAPWKAALFNKIISCLFGGIMIGLAFICKGFTGILQAAFTVMGVMSGPSMGIFTIGLMIPHVGKIGGASGIIGSVVIMAWTILGANQYNPPPELLPLYTDQCNITANTTFSVDMISTSGGPSYQEQMLQKLNVSGTANFGNMYGSQIKNAGFNVTTIMGGVSYDQKGTGESLDDWPLMYVYGISYTFYTTFGSAICIIISIVVTLFTGSEDLSEIRPELIAPMCRFLLPKKVKQSSSYGLSYTPVASADSMDYRINLRGNLSVPPPHMIHQPDS